MLDASISPGLRARVALEKHGFSFTHSLGQNFILDDAFLSDIARMSGVGGDDCVLEIGPGPGVLTSYLARQCSRVISLEIDTKLQPVLEDVLAGTENAQIIFEDCMRADIPSLLNAHFPGKEVQVVANLPYYITADVIERLLTCGANIGNITVMVQKEAAERIGARIGEKNYCALAMLVQYYCNVETLMDVPPEFFTPRPHVMSRLIRLTKRGDVLRARNELTLQKTIRSAFRMRRKTLVNNLTGDFPLSRADCEEILTDMNLDARVRGEALTVEQMVVLSDAIEDKLHPTE